VTPFVHHFIFCRRHGSRAEKKRRATGAYLQNPVAEQAQDRIPSARWLDTLKTLSSRRPEGTPYMVFLGGAEKCVSSAGWRIREIPDCASSPKTHSFPSGSGGSTKAHVQLFGAALGLELLRRLFNDAVVWRRRPAQRSIRRATHTGCRRLHRRRPPAHFSPRPRANKLKQVIGDHQ